MKKFLALLVVALLVLPMFACGQSANPAASQPQAAASGQPSQGEPSGGGGEKVGETLKIGVVCPISGQGAAAGKYITNGVKLIEDKLAAEGGLLVGDTRYPIQFVYEDNEAKEETTANVFQKLINQDNVIAIAGPDMSKCILAAAPIAQQAGCVAVGTFTTNEAVTQVGDYIFRACFIDSFQGWVAATYAWEEGYKTAGIIYNNADAYSKGLYESFKECFEGFGGQIVEVQAYSGSDVKDFNVQLTKIAAANPEVLFIPNMFTEIPLQIQQARAVGITCPIVGGDSMDTPDVPNLAGFENIKGTAYVSAFSAENPEPIAQEFVTAFRDAYGMEPNSNAVLAYESVAMILDSIQRAATVDRAGVRDAMASIKNLQLPSGIITVGMDRNPIKGAAVLMYDEKGAPQFVKMINP
ncbi:ABC transporter substrate-binding protein [Oscillospiraceae bacterium MB08-C2-2]|nr:ABC transporter substrate-binding protein [Oscillospiraceae bacterium MB08-C2-2]